MLSSQVLVLSFAVRFLSLLPASLPQPFHRCLPSALTSGPFHFRLPFFRPFLFRFQLLSFLFLPFLLFPFPLTVGLLRCCLSAFQLPGSSTSVPPGFPCFPSISQYSAFCLFPFILPGFAPTTVPPVLPSCSRFRAFPLLPLSFVRFRLVLTTQPSDLSFPFFPFSPVGGSFGACRFLSSPTLSSSVRPVSMPSFRFRYSAFCVSFLLRRLASQGYLSASTSSFRFRPHPLGFRFRFRLLSSSVLSSRTLVSRSLTFRDSLVILARLILFVNIFFQNFSINFIFLFFALSTRGRPRTKSIGCGVAARTNAALPSPHPIFLLRSRLPHKGKT